MYIERLKTFFIAFMLLPTTIMAQMNGEAEDGVNGAVNGEGVYWSGWGWFWLIVLLVVIAAVIWYVVSSGGARGGGATRGGTQRQGL